MRAVSATIITLNEEVYIGRCLKSLEGIADEIIVVDSFSTDRTAEICRSMGVRFYQREFPGYRDQKNYASSLATHEYILSVDADEELSEELRQSLIEFKNMEGEVADGYSVNRLNAYRGQWIKGCGWYPDRKVRLYNRNRGRWGGYNVHEVVVMERGATTARLRGDLLHRVYDSLEEFAEKVNLYSTLSSMEYQKHGRKGGLAKALFHMVWCFFRSYIVRGGFLEGPNGYIICKMLSYGVFLKYIKLRDLNRRCRKEAIAEQQGRQAE